MKVTFLGTGTSNGVPMIGCDCNVCHNANDRTSRNHRLRCSILVEYEAQKILVDTSMDFRQQMISHPVPYLTAVVYTHEHADHIYGLPDIRSYTKEKKLPCFGSKNTMDYLTKTFTYMFEEVFEGGGVPSLELNIIEKEFLINDLKIIPLPVFHGSKQIYGYRFGRFAYIPDVNKIPDDTYPLLENLEVLVIDALRITPHSTHFSLSEAIAESQKIAPKYTYLTHISHKLDYYATSLPDDVYFAYDGLQISV